MELKQLTYEDLEFVRGLRNHYRACFFDQNLVSEEQQKAWFELALNSYIGFYIIWESSKRIGTVSLRTHQDSVIEIGNIMMHPSRARNGVMSEAILSLMSGGCNYVAFVKHDNTASLDLFRKLGFADSTPQEDADSGVRRLTYPRAFTP